MISREAILAEARFSAFYWHTSQNDALMCEAVSLLTNRTSFDSDDTKHWLATFFPDNHVEVKKVKARIRNRYNLIHQSEASYNHYNYEYTQFMNNYDSYTGDASA